MADFLPFVSIQRPRVHLGERPISNWPPEQGPRWEKAFNLSYVPRGQVFFRKVQPYDVWNFPSCHELFGGEHPGRIPGELIFPGQSDPRSTSETSLTIFRSKICGTRTT